MQDSSKSSPIDASSYRRGHGQMIYCHASFTVLQLSVSRPATSSTADGHGCISLQHVQ